MRVRSIPFGYQVVDGETVRKPDEAAVVQQIFECYAHGKSLKSIAEELTERRVEYLPEQFAWNKNRVGRILKDIRYLGTDEYPEIIKEDCFQAAARIRAVQNTQRAYNKDEVITTAVTPILCSKCGSITKRLNVKTSTYFQKRVCTNPNCACEYRITDARLNELIRDLLRGTEIYLPQTSAISLEIRRMENEIERLLEFKQSDAQTVRKLIYDVAAEKYRLLTAGLELTDKLRTDLTPARLSSCNIRKTVMETVRQINLINNDAIELTLINGQVLGKEHNDGTDDAAENDSDDPAIGITRTKASIA